MSLRHSIHRLFVLLACAACAGAGFVTWVDAAVDPAKTTDAFAMLQDPPCRLASTAPLERVPVLVGGDKTPELLLAQRAIQRDFGPDTPPEPYAVVDIPGWKSVGGAAAMSFVLPGTGQLYTGNKRGYLFLGVEAVALLGYATFQSQSDKKTDEYHEYVGDPNDPESRFSFDRLAGQVPAEEMSRLRTIYERDPDEFYQAVTLQGQYAAGWSNPDERYDAQVVAEDADKQRGRSRASSYVLIANHLVSAFDALNLARFNNIALRENMTLKLKLKPSLRHGSYAFTLTQKF